MPHESYRKLESALRDFATVEQPGALLLRGEWGVGKTYACLQALRAREGKEQSPFSYVSLYGVTSLNDVYARIALGWNNSVTQAAPSWLKDAMGAGSTVIKGVADIFKAGSVVEAIGTAGIGLMARKALVVIDDLERRDETLSINAALGVVSYLVDSRECRIIFISNDGALSEADKIAFDTQKEKVFDTEVVYNPSVEENAAIFGEPNLRFLLPSLNALKIRNVRVIRRVNRFLEEFQRHLDKGNEKANEVVLRNASILGLLYHGFRSKVDLENRRAVSYLETFHRSKKENANLSLSDRLLQDAQYFQGPADDEIVEYLQGGTLDWEALNEKLKDQEHYFKKQEARSKLRSAVRKCYSNFIATADEITTEIMAVCDAHAELIDPSALEEAEKLFITLGQKPSEPNWVTRWETANIPALSDKDLGDILQHLVSYPAGSLQKIRQEAARRRGKADIQGTLSRTFSNQLHSTEELREISEFPVVEYSKWIENTTSDDVRSLITSVFEDFYGKPSPKGTIAAKTLQAINLLETGSVINKVRVEAIKRSCPGLNNPV